MPSVERLHASEERECTDARAIWFHPSAPPLIFSAARFSSEGPARFHCRTAAVAPGPLCRSPVPQNFLWRKFCEGPFASTSSTLRFCPVAKPLGVPSASAPLVFPRGVNGPELRFPRSRGRRRYGRNGRAARLRRRKQRAAAVPFWAVERLRPGVSRHVIVSGVRQCKRRQLVDAAPRVLTPVAGCTR
jgi:hypothetical protein